MHSATPACFGTFIDVLWFLLKLKFQIFLCTCSVKLVAVLLAVITNSQLVNTINSRIINSKYNTQYTVYRDNHTTTHDVIHHYSISQI